MLDLDSVCRTCLREDDLLPIFARTDYPERYVVALFLTTGLQIEQNDGLPQSICSECIALVNSALQLRNTSHRAERRLLRSGFHRAKLTKTKHTRKKRRKTKQKRNSAELRKKYDFDNETNERYNLNDAAQSSDNPIINANEETNHVQIDLESLSDEIAANDNGEFMQQCLFNSSAGLTLQEDCKTEFFNADNNIEFKPNPVPQQTKHERHNKSNKEKKELLLNFVEGKLNPNGPVQCKVCKKTVASWSSFRSHCKLHLGFDFVCEYCGKSFISVTQLRRHKSSRHGEERALVCAHCPYRALDKPQLLLHERRQHTGERPFVCDSCGASYHSRRCLIQHIETHSIERTIQCPQCPSMFKSRRHLARHVYGCHAPPTHQYRCHVCCQLYRKLKYARRHMSKMHGLSTREQGVVATVKVVR